MKKKHLSRFNLIEIILAMGVVALGMTAVLALLPPALNANRDSQGDAVAIEAATNMIAYIDFVATAVVADNQSDDTWKSGVTSRFTAEDKVDFAEVATVPTSKLEPPSLFDCFRIVDAGKQWVYVLNEGGTDIAATNVVVWRNEIPNLNNAGAGTERPGYRFYIRVGWPADAPSDAEYRQERTFVYEIIRPAKK